MKKVTNILLKVYNGVSIALWLAVLYHSLQDVYGWASSDPKSTYIAKTTSELYPHQFLNRVQLFNIAFEVFHSITGIVPTPLPTLLLQLSARAIITAGISYKLPDSPGNYSWGYATLSTVWAVSDVIKYTYYFVKLFYRKGASAPEGLTWLRYTAFIFLYPLGLAGELYVVYTSLGTAEGAYHWFLIFALANYLPGFSFLYVYMLKQRKKVLFGRKDAAKKAS